MVASAGPESQRSAADPPVEAGSQATTAPRGGLPWTPRDTWALLAITLAGGALRLWRLGTPDNQVFDENFYAKDACNYATTLVNECGLRATFEVHPPMGKWPMALGIELFGFNSFGVRIFPALAGMALIVVTYLMARRLLDSTLGATVAASFVALDLLLFVHSRLAMLDIFLALFVTTAFLFVTWDTTARTRTFAGVSMRWRLLAGAFFGAAIATKWVAAFALFAGILLVIVAEARAHRETGATHPYRATLLGSGWGLMLSFVLVPVAVYLASYVGRVQGELVALPWQEGTWLRALWDQHVFMLDYFETPRERHFYWSSPLAWLTTRSPFPYHFETEGTRVGGITAMGSPLMWWPAIGAIAYGAVRWARARTSNLDAALPMAGLLATYAAWLFLALIGHEHFYLYYLVPAIPFLGLLVALAIVRLVRPTLGAYLSFGLIVSWAAFLIFMYPMLAAVRVDAEAWAHRARLYRICPVPEEAVERFTLSQRLNDACRAGGLPFVPDGQSKEAGPKTRLSRLQMPKDLGTRN
jgi:dolichyl-phosphate-mannose-protein mannosyltransferase